MHETRPDPMFRSESIQLVHSSSPTDSKYWRVQARLEAPNDFFDSVQEVIFERHPTFKNRIKHVKSPPFEDSFKCWGEFILKAEIVLKDGQVIHRQRYLSLDDNYF